MKLVILDRDGVINEDSDTYIKSPQEWHPISGSMEAIVRLNQAEYRVVIATNQSGIARGLFSLGTLTAIHDKMYQLLAHQGGHIDAIFFCPHRPRDKCACRKPKPGLLQEIANHYTLDPAGIPVVGDSLRDLQAAYAIGARPMLVRTGKGEQTLKMKELPADTAIFSDLSAVVAYLLTAPQDKP